MRLPQSRNRILFLSTSLAVALIVCFPPAVPPVQATSNAPDAHVLKSQTLDSGYYVELGWNPSNSNGVVGYNIYRGHNTGGPYRKINRILRSNTWFNDHYVRNGKTYYYVTTAVNSQGQESAYSNEARAIIPNATTGY